MTAGQRTSHLISERRELITRVGAISLSAA